MACNWKVLCSAVDCDMLVMTMMIMCVGTVVESPLQKRGEILIMRGPCFGMNGPTTTFDRVIGTARPKI